MANTLTEVAVETARGSYLLFVGDLVSTATLTVGSLLVARFLGPSDYGLYSLTLIFPILLVTVSRLGIEEALVRFPAKLRAEGKTDAAHRVILSATKLRLCIGFALSVITFLLSDPIAIHLLKRPEIGSYLKIASIVILLQGVFSAAYSAFVGLDRMGQSALLKSIMSVVKSSVSPALIILGFGITGAVTGHVLGYAVAAVLGLLMLFLNRYYRKSGKLSEERNHSESPVRSLFRYSLPLYFSSLIAAFVAQFQLILLASYVTDSEIGNFSAAVNLSVLLTILVIPISTAMFPAFSKFDLKKESDQLRALFSRSVTYTSLMVVPLTMALMVFSKEVVFILYGSSFVLAPAFLLFYVSTFLLVGLGYHVLGSFFNGIGETKQTLRLHLVQAAVFVILAPVATVAFGVQGLIVALVTSNLGLTVYGIFIVRKKCGIQFSPSRQLCIYGVSGLAAASSWLFSYFSPLGTVLNLIAGMCLFLFVYLTLAPILGAAREDDVESFRRIFSRIRFLWPLVAPILAYETRILLRLDRKLPEHRD